MKIKLMLILFVGVIASFANAGQFHVKNCLKERVFVCAYNKDDTALTFASQASGVKAGTQKKFECNSDGSCKVFIGVSKKHIQSIADRTVEYLSYGPGEVIGAGVNTAAGGLALAIEAGAVTAEATATVAVGGAFIAAGAATLAAAVLIGNAADVNNQCKNIIQKVKHGKGARLKHVSGHHTLALLTSDQGQKMYMGLLDGDKSCQ